MKLSSLKISIYFVISTLLVGLFSCDDPYKVGLELQANNQLVGTSYTDTFSIDAKLVLQDNIYNTDAFNTSSSPFFDSRRMLGHFGIMQDAQFGITQASLYTNLFWGATKSFDYDSTSSSKVVRTFKAIGLDSARILLTIDNVYGDTLTPITIKVEQLLQSLDTTRRYFADQEVPVTREIARRTIRPTTRLGIPTSIAIPLNTSFAQELFEKSGKTELSSSEEFRKYMKGLKISVEGNTPSSMVSVNMAGSSSIELYVRYDGTFTRRVANYYFVTANGTVANRNQWFSSVKSNFSPTPFLNKLQLKTPLSTQQTNHKIYLQDGTGLVAWLDFPTLRNLNKQNKEEYIMLNRAELYFFTTGDIAPNQAPSDLFFYESAVGGVDLMYDEPLLSAEIDPSKRIAAMPIPIGRDFAGNTLAPLNATYVKNGFTYTNTFLTRYLQSVIDGKDTQNKQGQGMFIVPGFLHVVPYQTSSQQFVKHHARLNKTVLYDNSTINGDKRMRLRLYYTKFKR
jgi:hypothetical protein